MITNNSGDVYQGGFWPQARVHWRYVDTTGCATALGRAHLSGPTASLVLAESLVAVALLKGELSEPEETISLQLKVDGPLRGVLVECSVAGALRGYTHAKVMNSLDGLPEITAAAALGDNGMLGVIRSLPGRLLSQASLAVVPPQLHVALDNYFAFSLQRVAFVIIEAQATPQGVTQARGLLVESLPDGDKTAFEALRQLALSGELAKQLRVAESGVALCEALQMEDVEREEPLSLRFECRCSREKALNLLHALSQTDLEEMVAAGEPAGIDCHMCGERYTFGCDLLQELLALKKSSAGS